MTGSARAIVAGIALAVGGTTVAAAERAPAPGQPATTVEGRLDRIERLLDSQALVEMLSRIDALQQEIQVLRGEVERQTHSLEGIKQRQRDLYLDIDRRLSRIEREGVPAAPVSGGASPSASALQPSVVVPATSALTPPPARPASTVSAPPAAQPATPASPAAGSSTQDLAKEREAYQQAFDLLRELRYDQAITAFQAFMKSFPEGRYAHIAQYWLGEANYARRDFAQAIVNYEQLLARYPQSPKLAEALLKIGYSHYELGDKAKAQQVLNDLLKKYPNTTESGQAQNLLLKIRREVG